MLKQQHQKRQQNNKGFSLVELMVVVAIMGVMMAVVFTTMNSVKSANVNNAANTVKESLNVCREKAMTITAKEWKVVIHKGKIQIVRVYDDEGREETSVVQESALPDNIDINVTEDGVNLFNTDDVTVSISYKLLSGEVASVYYNNGDTSDPSSASSIKSGGTKCGIIASYKNKKKRIISLYYSTGKHSTE